MNQLETQLCPLCRLKSNYKFTSKNQKEIYLCENINCNHLFTPQTKVNQGVTDRDQNFASISNNSLSKFNKRNERLLNLFLSKIKKKKDLVFIDFGSGDAHISRTFKSVLKNNVEIYCVEKGKVSKGFYKNYGLKKIIDLSETRSKADVIYLVEVIEHINNPISLLKLLRKYLKPNGLIFISTPHGSLEESNTNAYDDPSHLHFFTEKSLNYALYKSMLKTTYKFKAYPLMYPQINDLALWRRPFAHLKKYIVTKILKPKHNYVGHLITFTSHR